MSVFRQNPRQSPRSQRGRVYRPRKDVRRSLPTPLLRQIPTPSRYAFCCLLKFSQSGKSNLSGILSAYNPFNTAPWCPTPLYNPRVDFIIAPDDHNRWINLFQDRSVASDVRKQSLKHFNVTSYQHSHRQNYLRKSYLWMTEILECLSQWYVWSQR